MKNFVLRESASIQFRAEAFNLFNHPNLGGPDTAVDDNQSPAPGVAPPFGKIFGSQQPRILQMSLALKF